MPRRPYPIARAWYRSLLLTLPALDRASLGGDMEAIFVGLVERAGRARGWAGRAGAVLRGSWDVLTFAAAAHRHARYDRRLTVIKTGRPPEGPMTSLRELLANLAQDIRFAARLLVKDRSFTITALLTLAICIGANTAIFSIVRSVVLKPLPIPNASRIIAFHNNYPNAGAVHGSTGVPDYYDRMAQMDVASEYALYRRQGATLGAADGVRRITTVRATPSFFRLTSMTPTVGRIFTEQEGEPGQESAAILSDGLWHREYGGARDVVGKTILLSGTSYQIVGVAPPGFTFLWNDVDVYLPAAFTAQQRSDDQRHSNNWNMAAMLKDGRTPAQAQEEVDAVNRRNDERFPQLTKLLKDAGFYTEVAVLQDELVRDVRPVLFLLWGGVVFVLLIGCLNIANLVMVRATGRSREMATRHAVGADLSRLARQIFTETTLLSIAGGVIGIALGWWALRLVPLLHLDEMPRGYEIALDPVTAATVFGAAVGVGVLIGCIPAFRLWKLNVNTALREEGRSGTAGRHTNVLRKSLAVAQVTIAFVLLIGAGLLLASFRQVLRIDPGFSTTGVVTGAITLPGTAYKDDQLGPFVERLLTNVRALPGVQHAAITSNVPLSGEHSDSVILAEGYVMKPGESLISPLEVTVTDGYFEAMRIALVKGRYFTPSDTNGAMDALIVDERMAAHFWPGQDPIGRRLYKPGSAKNVFNTGPDTRWLTVIGVVKSVQSDALIDDHPSVGAYYHPYYQMPENGLGLVVQSTRPSTDVVPELRKTLAALDPTLPLYEVKTMDQYLDDAVMPRRMPMLLAMAFAAVALFLASIGIYGVLAYGVAQRRREIGIRLALGSTARDVFGLVLKDGLRIVVIGMALGFIGLLVVRQALSAVLYGVTPMDPMVIGAVASALALVALLAMIIPARRAATVNPATALFD